MNKTTVPTETKTTKTTRYNVVLDGVETLHADRIVTTHELTWEISPKTKRPYKVLSKKLLDEQIHPLWTLHLAEVSKKDLDAFRYNDVPSFVLKIDGKLYHSEIPRNLALVSYTILGKHMCSVAGHECHRLSAASDSAGGCAKVRNRSKNIEDYDWITTGYETFNTKIDSFVVVHCSHYKPCPPREKLDAETLIHKKIGLAQFVWEDVTSLKESRARYEENCKKNRA